MPGIHYRDESPNAGPVATGNYSTPEGTGGGPGNGGGSQSSGRVHVRTTMDGLAGIGRGTTFGPPGSWPAPRFLYIPSFGANGPRAGTQQSGVGNSQMDARVDLAGRDLPAHSGTDGLTAVVSLSQGGPGAGNVSAPGQSDLTVRAEDSPLTGKPPSLEPLASNVHHKSNSHDLAARDWEGGEGSSIMLDLQTPLRSFPPFRFGYDE